jgi:hypothetical protein
MPWICTPAFPAGCAPGVKSGPWFHPDMQDEPVPLTVQRRRLDPGATDRIPLRGRENFGYVIAGSAGALAANNLWYQAGPLVAHWLAETL